MIPYASIKVSLAEPFSATRIVGAGLVSGVVFRGVDCTSSSNCFPKERTATIHPVKKMAKKAPTIGALEEAFPEARIIS